MSRRRTAIWAAICAATLAGVAQLGGLSPADQRVAVAAPDTAPVVTIDAPENSCREAGVLKCVRGILALSATATPSAGRRMTAVEFQYRTATRGEWTTIPPRFTGPGPSYSLRFSAGPLTPGPYDFRVVATDSAGETSVAVARDRVVATGVGFVEFDDPGPLLRGTVTLNAYNIPGQENVNTVRFERSLAGAEDWKELGTAVDEPPGETDQRFSVDVDVSTLPDGLYDLRVVAEGLPDIDPEPPDYPTPVFVSKPRRDRRVDTTAPSASLAVPPGPLQGEVTLTATTNDGTGSGIASVRFERSIAGSGTWAAIGTRARPDFTQVFDTRLLDDGLYELRVVASDRAGNTAPSPTIGIEVRNPGRVPPDQLSVANISAPARDLRLLGTTKQGETWATGTTTAAPASVDGRRLEYAGRGNQIVLLRYTEAGGWQIRDVLRNADGSAFVVKPGARLSSGQMTASGEAWIALRQPGTRGRPGEAVLFRRRGTGDGRFLLDTAAREVLDSMLTGDVEVQVNETAGRAYGLLISDEQDQLEIERPVPGGKSVKMFTRLDYGVLDGAAWTRKALVQPDGYVPREGDYLKLQAAYATGPGEGWVATVAYTARTEARESMVGQFGDGAWRPITTGLDVLDRTDAFSSGSVEVTDVNGDGDGVWIGARSPGQIVAYYSSATGEVTKSWCAGLGPASTGCGAPLNPDHPAIMPQHVFDTPRGTVAVGLQSSLLRRFVHGDWTGVAAPGFSGRLPGGRAQGTSDFTSFDDGWLAGSRAFGRVTAKPLPESLATWPQANRSTLLAVALAPGSAAGVGDSGHLAVGLDGTALRYDAAAGWQIETTPSRANRQALRSVAFSDPSTAVAVGGAGTILRWDGSSWSEDPQSTQITQNELLSVAFRPGGEGWAVGRFESLLHFDGSSWTAEELPPQDAGSGVSITSVAIAGDDVFAVAGGNLIQRGADGRWRRVGPATLPDEPESFESDLRLVAGLPDGGAVVAGRSVVITRQRDSERFEFAEQPVEGIAVGLSAFRDADGRIRAFLSAAPPATREAFPSGDGTLLRQTGNGWQDVSRNQNAGDAGRSEGLVKLDPVLAVAAGPAGTRAWAVGGYAGTRDAANLGTDEPLQARAAGWRTAHIWRYDSGGPAQSQALEQATLDGTPSAPDTVTFAYFSSAECRFQCTTMQDAQPDVNLGAATRQIAELSQQPGGPAFAVFGGNARGPIDRFGQGAGDTAADFARLPRLLAPLGPVPLFAAFGPKDAVHDPSRDQEADRDRQAQPWASAFARAPAPFGTRPAPEGITPAGNGSAVGTVHRYYAFDARQNEGTVRVIVIDDSTVTATVEENQSRWLDERLADASAAGLPVVVMVGRPLGESAEDRALAQRLVGAGILAVFAASTTNERTVLPVGATADEPQIPQYAGATMGYQRSQNNGVAWYSVTVDTVKRTVDVSAIPIIETLALKPLLGLSTARSSTLAFEAVGRRPVGTLGSADSVIQGIDNYATIPAPSCSRCIPPGYTFSSSDPSIGDFVAPSGPGSRFPRLDSKGKPVPSKTSGLFCGYNSGESTVSITTGFKKASLPVTVRPGGIGRPCGTVFRAGVNPIVLVPRKVTKTTRTTTPPPKGGAPTPPAPVSKDNPLPVGNIAVPAPPLKPSPVPTPPSKAPPPPPPPPPPSDNAPVPPGGFLPPGAPVAVPPLPTAAQPVPPGGSASASAAAKRKEKARKHASQSASFTVRPSGVSGEEWFFPSVAVVSVLTLMMLAGTLRPGPRPRPRPALARPGPATPQPRPGSRRWR